MDKHTITGLKVHISLLTPKVIIPHLSAEVHPLQTRALLTHIHCNNRLLWLLWGHMTSAQRCFDVSVLFFQAHTLMPALYIVTTW